jgi:hypothetical protein
VKEDEYDGKYYVFMYKNEMVRLVEIVLRRGKEGIKEKD